MGFTKVSLRSNLKAVIKTRIGYVIMLLDIAREVVKDMHDGQSNQRAGAKFSVCDSINLCGYEIILGLDDCYLIIVV